MSARRFLPEWLRSWWACRSLNRLHRLDSLIARTKRVLEGVEENQYTEGFRAQLVRRVDEAVSARAKTVERLNWL